MKGTKQYRFEDNPLEKLFHDRFIEMMARDKRSRETLSAIVSGWSNDKQNEPKKHLTEEEETICINLIQWLGSPVGQGFVRDVHEEFKKHDSKESYQRDKKNAGQ